MQDDPKTASPIEGSPNSESQSGRPPASYLIVQLLELIDSSFRCGPLFLRFRPEVARAAKPAEIASMVKDEVEPIGGFIGDAFIQPAFLLSQAGTALVFIMVQSPSMGLAALAVVLVQAVVIPYLRREQIRLGRLRQLASRQLAGRIGEAMVRIGSLR